MLLVKTAALLFGQWYETSNKSLAVSSDELSMPRVLLYTSIFGYRVVVAALLVVCMSAVVMPWNAQAGGLQGADLAERRLQTGLVFAADGRITEAMTDFEAVVTLYPTSAVADNALLEMARVHLDATGDLDRAAEYASRIVDDATYSQSDAAPEAYVLLARVAMARDHRSRTLDAALAQLQRGLGLWPGAPAVPQMLFFMGEVHRHAGRLDGALDAYTRLVAGHRASVWAARATLETGVLLGAAGDVVAAMTEFQRVRDTWPDTDEAEEALHRVSILYRLYVRAADQTFLPAGSVMSTRGMRRIDDLVTDKEGRLFYATDREVGAAEASAVVDAPTADRPRGLARDVNGAVVAIVRGGLTRALGGSVPLAVPRAGGEAKELREIDAARATTTGDWLVMDSDERQIHRFSSRGEYVGVFAEGRVKRLAVGPNDRVAVIDRDNDIRLVGEGRLREEIPREGPGYEIDDPVDLAYDVFGHLYVADERQIFIFGPDQQLRRRFPTTSNREPGMPRKITAFALEPSGALLIADDDEEQVLRYR